MAISSPGLGSGLDVNGLVSQLMALERQPIKSLDLKEAKLQAQISAFGSVKGALSGFQSAVAALAAPARFAGMKANVADTSLFTASAASSAAGGSYQVDVQTLAAAQKLKSGTYSSTTQTIDTGTITIQFGTYDSVGNTFTLNPEKSAQTITIDAGKSTLAGVRDAINAANAGVTASIVNDGSGNRLVISSNSTGLANTLKITVSSDGDGNDTDNAGLSQLAYDPTAAAGSGKNLSQTAAAANATLLVDGIAISKNTNTISDAIEGVTLNLAKAGTTTLTVAKDTASIRSSIDSFVKAYNDLNKALTDLTRYDAASKKASVLTGDATVRALQSQLKSVFNTALTTAGGGLSSLADIGITFQTDGTLKLDSTKLDKVLADPTKDVSTLFAAVGKPSDSLISFVSSTDDTRNGNYAVSVTQLATQGKAVGAGAAGLTITAGVNDQLTLSVDGVATTVTLAAGTYTAATLAAELQSKINGASALASAGASTTVTQSAGVLTVTSARYGSASKVQITGGTAANTLFGGTATSTDGVDAAGTIGGVAATGSGQTLTAASGDAKGLQIKVLGGSAPADRGSIAFARGFAYELEKLAGKLLEDDGPVDARLDGLNTSVKDIGKRREALEARMVLIEKRLRAQFTALDTMLASMSKTSSYLQQQLANLPKIGE